MKHVLSSGPLSVLAECVRAKTLLAFDFDGTLAPLGPDRDRIAMRHETAELFERACTLYPCAVISGRSRRDVAARFGGAPVRYVIGNHGIEEGPNDLPALERPIARARTYLDMALASEAGVAIEDKRLSLSIHYRHSPRQRRARAAILAAVAALPAGLRAVPGLKVINVVPDGAPNKGDALRSLIAREGADTALFIGDDVTDEDAFRIDRSRRLFGVRIGWSLFSAAKYFVRDQREVDHLLAWLVALRVRA